MEPFHVERVGNKILANREPKTPTEVLRYEQVVEEALVYMYLTGNPYVEYPNGQRLKNPKNLSEV